LPQINAAGLALIKSFESCSLTAYPDPGSGAEPWTIGWGHTGTVNGTAVHSGMTITQGTADILLAADLHTFEETVNNLVAHGCTPNQFAALVSFEYNTGSLAQSTLLRLFNAGNIAGAADQFGNWVYAGGQVMAGLVRRRAAEKALFLTP
jgi:lysozyme